MIILHTITRGFGGGTMKALDQSIEYERSLGHEVWLCSGTRRVDEINFFHIPSLNREIGLISDFRALLHIRSIIHQIRPDIIHSHESKAGVLTRVLAKKFNSIVFVHTVHMATFHSRRNSIIQGIYAFIEKIMAKQTDVLVFVSSGLQNIYNLKNIQPKSLAMTIHSRVGIDLFRNRIPFRFEDQNYVRSILGVSASSKIILCVGLLESRKRPALVLRDFSEILKIEDSYHLLFLGEGPLREELERSVEKMNLVKKVHFAGFRQDIERWVAGSNVLVLASKFEGFPQIPLQAASLGIPTVAIRLEEYGSTELLHFVQEGESMVPLVETLIDTDLAGVGIDSRDELRNWDTQLIDARHLELLEILDKLRKAKL
jgi:glycosyltransferase involved in cell wall biosynthesis